VSKLETPAGKTELIVYWCHSFERGPEHRVFDEDDIQVAGGINGIEMELQRDSCWFARLGVIEAQQSARGWSYTDEAIAALPEADPGEWRLGRLNPAFRRGPFERHIFESLFRNLSAMLKNWAHEEEEAISGYVIKQIDISPDRLSSIASALASIRHAHEVVGLTVIKYWYDPEWKVTSLPCDLILAQVPISIPVRLRLDGAEEGIATDVLLNSSCQGHGVEVLQPFAWTNRFTVTDTAYLAWIAAFCRLSGGGKGAV
jgi:hypothetical protein